MLRQGGSARAFQVQDVAQVVVTPFSHLMHAATHCLKSFGLYDGKRVVAHLLVIPVTSPSGEQGDKDGRER